MKKLIALVSIICIGISFSGCSKQQSPNVSVEKSVSHNYTEVTSKIGSTEDFIKLLEKSGHKVNTSTQENKSWLSGTLTSINIDSDTIAVYEYKNNEQMENDLKTINSSGTAIGNAEISWVNPPHLYKSGNIIVLYVGDNNGTIGVLEKLLGKQFAGM